MPIDETVAKTLEDVANLALGKIGENKKISDLETDVRPFAETVRRFIYQVIREVQAEFKWTELIKSVEFEVPMSRVNGTYQYTIPSDFLRPADNHDQYYVFENNYIFTDVSGNFPFRYVRYSKEPKEWSALLLKCVYFRLALEICMPVCENSHKYNSLLEEYEKVVFPRAKVIGSYDNESPRSRRAGGRYSSLRGGAGGDFSGGDGLHKVIGVAAPGHNHDEDYASIVHNHDGRYAAPDHKHDERYILREDIPALRSIPVGMVLISPVPDVPDGFLPCEGMAVLRNKYPELFAVIGLMYTTNPNAEYFNLPDYRGIFLRGWDHGSGKDPYAALRTARGDGTGGNVVGSKQDDDFKAHTHGFSLHAAGAGGGAVMGGNFSTNTLVQNSGGVETRPINISVLYIIKY